MTKDNGLSPLLGVISAIRLVLLFSLTALFARAAPVLSVVTPEKAISFTAEEFAALPHVEITALDPHAQKEHRYSGVAVRELLVRVGAPLGEKLRGSALKLMVVVHSRDGYAVAFTLADFDDAFSNRTFLLAQSEDGKPLPENTGPFRLIVPGDKKAARWARMVTSLELAPAGAALTSTTP